MQKLKLLQFSTNHAKVLGRILQNVAIETRCSSISGVKHIMYSHTIQDIDKIHQLTVK